MNIRAACILMLMSSAFLIFGEGPASRTGISSELPKITSGRVSETQTAVPLSFTATRDILNSITIVAFYGHPNSKGMGILGEFSSIGIMSSKLREYTDVFDKANGTKTAVPAFHIIFATAYPEGEIGLLNKKRLIEFIDYAEKNGILVVLDHQIGRFPVQDAVKSMLPYLKYPNVHLALDPEWATSMPGKEIGSVSAEDLNTVQALIGEYLEKENIPGDKMLIVHQFNWRMIKNRVAVRADYPRVALIHNADGFGTPEEKQKSWDYNKSAKNLPLKGMKLFLAKTWRKGGFDVPLFTPEEVLSFEPQPLFIQYQ